MKRVLSATAAAGLTVSILISSAIPANAFFHLPIIEVLRHLFHHAPHTTVPLGTTVLNTIQVVSRTTHHVSRFAAQDTVSRAVTVTVDSNLLRAGGSAVAGVSVAALVKSYGLVGSGAPAVDDAFRNEVAALAMSGSEKYLTQVCADGKGGYYGVPSVAKSCLDGSAPQVAKEEMNLSKIEKQ